MSFRGATVVFDLDGTLVHTAPDLLAAANAALRDNGFSETSYEALLPAVSLGARHMVEAALVREGVRAGDDLLEALTKSMLHHYVSNCAVHSRPFPDADPTLRRLIEMGATLAICTNKMEAVAKHVLGALGLEEHFAAICGRDSCTNSKPHPDHLRTAVAMAGGDIAWSVMVGDSEVDVSTAKAAGVPVVGVTFGYSPVAISAFEPDAVASGLSELPEIVGYLLTPQRQFCDPSERHA